MALAWPLTGRDEELRFVSTAIRRGRPARGVVLAGDAGVGKTRLARDTVAALVRRGTTVRWVWATASSSRTPLGAFEGLVGDLGLDSTRLISRAAEVVVGSSADVVIVVDDAHLLDDLSAHLVHHLTVGRGVAAVLTLRSGEPAPAAITSLWKDEHLLRLDVQALSEEETNRLLERVLGGRLESAALHRLWRLTEGNPLFLRHLVDAGLASGALHESEHVWTWSGDTPVSAELAEIVATQMGDLAADVREVVDLLALGEPLAGDQLADLVSAAAVEAAEARGLVRTEPLAVDVLCRLAHPIYGEIRRAALGTLRARRLRGRIVGVMGEVADPHDVLRRAVLMIESDVAADPIELLDAARLAVRLFDLALGERLAAAAIDAGGGHEAQLTRAFALSWLSRGDEADAILAELGSDVAGPLRVMVACSRIGNLFWTLGRADDAEAVLAVAERDVATGPAEPLLAAMSVAIDASLGRPRRALDRGLALLDRSMSPDLAVLMAASGVAASAAVLGQLSTASRAAALGVEAADRSTDGGIPRFGLADWHILALRLAGDVAGAEAVAQQARAASREVLGPAQQMGLVLLGHADIGFGRVRSAERWLVEAWAVLRSSSHEFRFRCRLHLTEALAMAGDAVAARELLADLEAERHPAYTLLEPENRLARAWVLAAEGVTSAAAAAAVEAAAMARSAGLPAYEVLTLQWAASFGDGSGVDRLTELTAVVEGPRAPTAAAHARALATADADALNAVSLQWERMGDVLAAADAAAWAARAFTARGLAGSAAVAAARAHRLAERCEGASTPAVVATASPLRLSDREREVVMLAAQGLSNREIAARLTRSVRTVEGHLYRVGQRLGVGDRDELAALLGNR